MEERTKPITTAPAPTKLRLKTEVSLWRRFLGYTIIGILCLIPLSLLVGFFYFFITMVINNWEIVKDVLKTLGIIIGAIIALLVMGFIAFCLLNSEQDIEDMNKK